MNRFLSLTIGVSSLMPFMAFASEGSGKVNDYVPMIREDRVWEYRLNSCNGWGKYTDVYLFQMKFEGEEVHAGKTYHKFVYVGDEAHWSFDPWDYDRYNEDLTIIPNEHAQYFLLREEYRRVYLYLDEQFAEVREEFKHWWSLDVDEILLYDFNLKVGDKTDIINILYSFPSSYINPDIMPIEHEIIDVGNVMIEGENCKSLSISQLPSELFAIEGIGCVENGILPVYNMDVYPTGYTGDYYNLNRVYDGAGDIIYRAYDEVDLSTLGIDEIGAELFTVRDGAVVAENSGREIRVSVFDISGREVANRIGMDKVVIPVADFTPGVYVARCESNGVSRQIKFVR